MRPEMDDGPIIVQKSVPVLDGDTPDTLADRVIEQEHIAYPEALDMVLKNGGHCLAAPPFRIKPGRELADQFVIREEELDFFRCRFRCVRAVYGIGINALGKIFANGASSASPDWLHP